MVFDLLVMFCAGTAAIVIGLLLAVLRKKSTTANDFGVAWPTVGGGLFLVVLSLFMQFLLTRK